jgi:hypothetical protein
MLLTPIAAARKRKWRLPEAQLCCGEGLSRQADCFPNAATFAS